MADEKLTNVEMAVLLVLMAEAGEVPNVELKSRFGFELKAANRRRLTDLKLISSRTERRRLLLALEDRGWRRCRDELGAATPVRPGPLGGALYAVLAGLHRHMDRAGFGLGEVFQPYDEPSASPTPAAGSVPGQRAADPVDGAAGRADLAVPAGVVDDAAGPADGAGLEERIRAAYRRLAGAPGDWVSLRRLRPLLGDVDRSTVDAALRRMDRSPEVNLIPEANQKTLSDADRQAAVSIGDRDNHLLAIGA